MANLAQSSVQLRSLCPACAGEGVVYHNMKAMTCPRCEGEGYVYEWVSLVELQARLLPAPASCTCVCTCTDLGLNPDCPVPDHARRAWELEKDMAGV